MTQARGGYQPKHDPIIDRGKPPQGGSGSTQPPAVVVVLREPRRDDPRLDGPVPSDVADVAQRWVHKTTAKVPARDDEERAAGRVRRHG